MEEGDILLELSRYGTTLTILYSKEVDHFHSLKMLILLNTMNQEATIVEVTMKLLFDHFFNVNPIGKNREILLIWKKELNVEIRRHARYFIKALSTPSNQHVS